MYLDLEKLLKEEKEFCRQKYGEAEENPREGHPTKTTVEIAVEKFQYQTPVYWLGRLAEIEIVLKMLYSTKSGQINEQNQES